MAQPRRREYTAAQAAALAEVTPEAIRQWVFKGLIRRNACGHIDGETFEDYLTERGLLGQEDPDA